MSKKLYVTTRPGKHIPHFGTRNYGEYWDNLPDSIVEELKDNAGFSLSAPDKPERKVEEVPYKRTRKQENEDLIDG